MLGNPQAIPSYLYEGRLVPLSKNKGKDQAVLKDIRPIVVRSHVAKILEKAIMAKVAVLAPPLTTHEDLPDRLQGGHLHLRAHLQADDPDSPWAGEEEEEVRCPHRPPESLRHGQQ